MVKEEEKEFLEIGEQRQDKKQSFTVPILFDKRQYYVKIPKRLMEELEHKKGDYLLFTLTRPFDIKKEPHVAIEFKRKDGT